jgi:Patatin-like phospholipase.
MKGGITSGVVYPLAISELAEEFRFKNVGGTSAGAIAAALTAAAEYARASGSSDGFVRLRNLPNFLAGSTDGEPNLLNLFPPTKSTRRLFDVATAFLGDGSTGEKIVSVLFALLLVSPLITILSFVPAVLLPFVLRYQLSAFGGAVLAGLLVAELALIAAGFGAMILGNAVCALGFTLPRNRFGFSTGKAPDDRNLPGVSQWLHDEIQATAGRASTDAPLTFGDLWLAGTTVTNRDAQLRECESDPDLRSINLQMITTALTHGHPYRLPLENRRFAFRASEFREYLSDDVVNHLVRHARADADVAAMKDDDLHALPEPWDLPIVVAARMSLSFPILFAMVPLYAVDHTLASKTGGVKQYDRCWFIDGGLSSNFPTNLFDSPLPRWPTFGINLGEFHPAHPKDDDHQENNVWMINGNGDGTSDHWMHFPDRGTAAMGGYIGAILDTIRNWRDNTQLAVPGFRDRIVHVKLSPDEGGLNLKMDPEKVKVLSERGMWAGRSLRERFGLAGASREGLNWNTHRWTRYRTSMALLQNMLRKMNRASRHLDPPYPDYNELMSRTADKDPQTGYWWPRTPGAFQQSTTEVLNLATTFSNTAPEFGEGAPRPTPEMRISPKL